MNLFSFLLASTLVLIVLIASFFLARLILKSFFYLKNPHSSDLNGSLVLVTGGTSGIGKITVHEMYLQGAKVLLTGRNVQALSQEVIPELRAKIQERKPTHKQDMLLSLDQGKFDEHGNYESERLVFRKVDAMDLAQVRAFCQWVLELKVPIYALIQNAGVLATFRRTTQGIESMIGVNHFSNLLIADMLCPIIEVKGRLVCVASIAGAMINKNTTDCPEFKKAFDCNQSDFSQLPQYAISKTCNIFLASLVQAVWKAQKKNTKAVSLHPGVVKTNITRNFGGFLEILIKKCDLILSALMRSEEEGAQTTIYCSSMPFKSLEPAGYYDNCKNVPKARCVTDENLKKFLKESSEKLDSVFPEYKLQFLKL